MLNKNCSESLRSFIMHAMYLFQSVLHLLESLAELSPSGRLLRCQASLLLGEASCVQQDETRAEMVAVFQGIGKLLKEQVVLPGVIDLYTTGLKQIIIPSSRELIYQFTCMPSF